MQTIHKQLNEIRLNSSTLDNVVNDYNMGLITMSEKHNQLLYILSTIEDIKKDICKEYGINTNAVNLMLTL
jgi:prophage tail gpP-like protein